MSTSLDPSSRLDTSASALGGAATAREGDRDDFTQYRSLSAPAVVALLFGVLSIAAMLPDYWFPKAIPAIGMVLAIASIWQIRARSDELTGTRLATIGLGLSTFFLAAGSGVSIYSRIAEVPEGYVRIEYEQLKPTDLEPTLAPAGARALDGRKVFIKGYMFPTDHDTGITRFVLCRDSGDCCFGGNPPLSDMVFVQLKDPLRAKYRKDVVRLGGTFHVAGSHSADVKKSVLYALEADYIE
jgi:hypothetical protein